MFTEYALTVIWRFPTSGGQYHFVAALAPSRAVLPLSWIQGWISEFQFLAEEVGDWLTYGHENSYFRLAGHDGEWPVPRRDDDRSSRAV